MDDSDIAQILRRQHCVACCCCLVAALVMRFCTYILQKTIWPLVPLLARYHTIINADELCSLLPGGGTAGQAGCHLGDTKVVSDRMTQISLAKVWPPLYEYFL